MCQKTAFGSGSKATNTQRARFVVADESAVCEQKHGTFRIFWIYGIHQKLAETSKKN